MTRGLLVLNVLNISTIKCHHAWNIKRNWLTMLRIVCQRSPTGNRLRLTSLPSVSGCDYRVVALAWGDILSYCLPSADVLTRKSFPFRKSTKRCNALYLDDQILVLIQKTSTLCRRYSMVLNFCFSLDSRRTPSCGTNGEKRFYPRLEKRDSWQTNGKILGYALYIQFFAIKEFPAISIDVLSLCLTL